MVVLWELMVMVNDHKIADTNNALGIHEIANATNVLGMRYIFGQCVGKCNFADALITSGKAVIHFFSFLKCTLCVGKEYYFF